LNSSREVCRQVRKERLDIGSELQADMQPHNMGLLNRLASTGAVSTHAPTAMDPSAGSVSDQMINPHKSPQSLRLAGVCGCSFNPSGFLPGESPTPMSELCEVKTPTNLQTYKAKNLKSY
jgi:hypothetical protein